jgi:hypothetical protein
MIAGLVAATAVGCGGGKTDDASKTAQSSPPAAAGQQAQQPGAAGQTAANPAQQAAQGAQQVAQGLQQMFGSQAQVKLIDSDALKTFLPDIAGYEKKNTKGEQMSMGVASFSHVETHYEKGDSTITLEIQDTALSQVLLAPLSMFMAAGFSEKSDDGYKKSTTVAGSPGFEEWEKEGKHAEITAIVANRFVISGKGSEVESPDVVRKIVEAVNFAKLATLK